MFHALGFLTLPLSPTIVDLNCHRGEWLRAWSDLLGSSHNQLLGISPKTPPTWACNNVTVQHMERDILDDDMKVAKGVDIIFACGVIGLENSLEQNKHLFKMIANAAPMFAVVTIDGPVEWVHEIVKSVGWKLKDVIRPRVWNDQTVDPAVKESVYLLVPEQHKLFDEREQYGFGFYHLRYPSEVAT